MSLEAKCYNSHSFITVSLLSAFNTVHNFDIICISEPYLISQKFSNDDKLSIPVIICSEQIIHRITDAEEFAYIIRSACLSDYKILLTFKNVFVLI